MNCYRVLKYRNTDDWLAVCVYFRAVWIYELMQAALLYLMYSVWINQYMWSQSMKGLLLLEVVVLISTFDLIFLI